MISEEEYNELQQDYDDLRDQVTALEMQIDDLEDELDDWSMDDLRKRGLVEVNADQVWHELTTIERPLLYVLDELLSSAKGYTPERLRSIVKRSVTCKQR